MHMIRKLFIPQVCYLLLHTHTSVFLPSSQLRCHFPLRYHQCCCSSSTKFFWKTGEYVCFSWDSKRDLISMQAFCYSICCAFGGAKSLWSLQLPEAAETSREAQHFLSHLPQDYSMKHCPCAHLEEFKSRIVCLKMCLIYL